MKISSVVFAFLVRALLRGKNDIFCWVTKFVEKMNLEVKNVLEFVGM